MSMKIMQNYQQSYILLIYIDNFYSKFVWVSLICGLWNFSISEFYGDRTPEIVFQADFTNDFMKLSYVVGSRNSLKELRS